MSGKSWEKYLGAASGTSRGMYVSINSALLKGSFWEVTTSRDNDDGEGLSGVRSDPHPPHGDGGATADCGLREYVFSPVER